MVLSGTEVGGSEDITQYYPESMGASSDEDLLGTAIPNGAMELTKRSSGIGWKFANQGTLHVCTCLR